MKLILRSLPQMLVMGAVVTTALFVPALVYSAYMMPWSAGR